ncbi:MAG: DUF4920 domain-containing protein [Cyclobacteriaceae bacterium]
MKNIAITVFLLSVSCASQPSYSSYGEEISAKSPVSTDEFLTLVSSDEESFKIEGVVEEVCQAKGCWMKIKNEQGQSIRITFKDYGFFVPKDIAGREVIFEGSAAVVNLEEDLAKHYADDSGKEYEEAMRKEIAIVASGVLVKEL